MTRVMARITLLILSTLPAGCAVGRPAIPEAVRHSSIIYKLADLETHRCLFEEAMTGRACLRPAGVAIETHATPVKDDKMAVFWRDTMINSIRRDIESYYHEYETQLSDGRRRFGSAIEVVALAGVTATTISKGERARTVIATMVSFLQGGHGKIDQGIFRDRTTDVIIQKMRASRARVETTILRKMADLDATDYGFSEAERDLRELFWAGTLQGGFLELSLSAGNDAAEAIQRRNETESRVRGLLPIPTQREGELLSKVDDEVARLTKRSRDASDTSEERENVRKTALKALNALKMSGKQKFSGELPENDVEKLLKLLRDEIKDALLSPRGLQEKLPIIAGALDVN